MQSNLTYEIYSKAQRDDCTKQSQSNKYVKSWNSPKSKLRNNIAKIDEELLSIKEKIMNVENTPKRSQSRFSFQYIPNCQDHYCSQDLKFCGLLKELNKKEAMIENMMNDMKIVEARTNSFHFENMELAEQLKMEMRSRMQLEQEIENLRQRLQLYTNIEFENSRLKEDNIKMFKIIEEMENRQKYNDNYFDNNKDSYITYDEISHTQPNIMNYEYPIKCNDSCYHSESQDSDLNSNTNYQSHAYDADSIKKANRINMPYGRDNRNEVVKPTRGMSPDSYEYQRTVRPRHEKSKSVELISFKKNSSINEEEDDNKNNQRNKLRPQQKIRNPYIKIDNNLDQAREYKNTETIKKLNNIKDQINQIQKHQMTQIIKTPLNTINQNQTTSDFSIDDINPNKDTRKRGRNQKSKNLERMKETNSLIDNQTEDLELPHHLETNLETISCDKVNKTAASTNSSNNTKVNSLLEKINQLSESLNQSKSDANNQQKHIQSIEEENEALKRRLNSNEKSKESLYKITESQASLVQEDNYQLAIHPATSFFNQPIQSKKLSLAQKQSGIKGSIFSKLKFKINSLIEEPLINVRVKLSDNLLFKPYDKKRLLCFDITNYSLSLIEFIDYSDYDASFNKSSLTYLNHEDGIYIITGENNNCLFSYTHSNNTLNKLANLSNNHSHGGLVLYHKTSSDEKCLVCLSGWYNRKVEEFSTKKNEWTSLPEMPIERGESSFLVSNNEKLFSFFGYHCPSKRYLNTIDFCYINSSKEDNFKWRSIQYSYQKEAFSLYLKSHSLVAVSPNQFVIVGGYDGKENHPIEYFINMSIDEESNNVILSAVNRKLYNIDKHHLYNFNCDFSPMVNGKGNQYQVCFDEEERAHVINTSKMTHDIFYFD